ncbi:CLUMA_CG007797, isoform A [Clunio marinus]|uniref:CLUMA_CG007797, isoform A n=1 Tax=Clunio marinus TaxID=568069 RepID=A0A1J1I3C9_9DIPT|nr:CLUMA_CG007797, isoform A [Clunio marinus]
MPEIHNKTIHSFSSEDSQFPARNLLETKVTKKWKCQETGEKSCFVVLKLDEPRQISGIDIGNEHSGFIEVLVGNSKQDPPTFKEILLATSFMTIVEAKNGTNPHRVRCFTHSSLVESVAKEKCDLVKIVCTQPFNNKLKYGLSFVTLHTPENIEDDDQSPVKQLPLPVIKPEDSNEKRRKFGKFTLRASSGSDSDHEKEKKNPLSPFDRWKNLKNNPQEKKENVKSQFKTKIEENRKRIRTLPDSSDDEPPKPKVKSNRNRSLGLVYEDEDDEPNEMLQKKMDRDKKMKEKEQKTHLSLPIKRDKTPPRLNPTKSKFSSFISSDQPSTSKDVSPRKSSKPSTSPSKTPSNKSSNHQIKPKKISFKPFEKLLEGVTFAFSGYVNPERGILRQKAIDMGAKYRSDWDNNCTHLICAFNNTPKYHQVKGHGKIVTKRWIEACHNNKKRLPWRRFALDKEDINKSESEEEIHEIQNSAIVEPDSDDDMMVVDKRVENGNSEVKTNKVVIENDLRDVLEVSTDDEMNGNEPKVNSTQAENQVFKNKIFYLNEDLSATEIIKLKNQIQDMMGRVTENPRKATHIISASGKRLPRDFSGEVIKPLWVTECHELEALIPLTRYKLQSN